MCLTPRDLRRMLYNSTTCVAIFFWIRASPKPLLINNWAIAIKIVNIPIRPNCSGKSSLARINMMINWIPCSPNRSKELQKRPCNVLLFNPSDIFQKLLFLQRIWKHDSIFVNVADGGCVRPFVMPAYWSSGVSAMVTNTLIPSSSTKKQFLYSP